MPDHFSSLLSLTLATCLITASPALADEQQAPKLSIELNAKDDVNGACRLTFVVEHNFEASLDSLVFETVLFNTSGQVDRLTLFDFGTVPAARPRVRQFELADLSCDALGRVLFNGANTCTGSGIAPGLCDTTLSVTTRVETEVTG